MDAQTENASAFPSLTKDKILSLSLLLLLDTASQEAAEAAAAAAAAAEEEGHFRRLHLSKLEHIHKRRRLSLLSHYQEQIDSHFSDLDHHHHRHHYEAAEAAEEAAAAAAGEEEEEEMERCRMKRSRLSSAAAATIAAIAAASSASTSSASSQGSVPRRLWVKSRSQAWWESCTGPDFPDPDFHRAFRMSKSTFHRLCEDLGASVAKEDTMLRQAIPVMKRVAVCVWRLATGEPLRLVSKRFGLGISTCHKLVLEVCAAINDVLISKYVQWPQPQQNHSGGGHEEMSGFSRMSGIPDVVGAMYTAHIPIIAPKVNLTAYYNKRHSERNQKTSYSVTLQGVVDPHGVFTDVCIGWPGSLSDEEVLQKSALYGRGLNEDLRGVWVVGGPSYPLLDWLLVPYAQQHHLNWTQHAFNEKAEEIIEVARNAFVRLKGRWRFLQKRAEVKLQELPAILGACCVLHNICEKYKESYEPDPGFEMQDDEMFSVNVPWSQQAMHRRDQIAHNLLHNAPRSNAP